MPQKAAGTLIDPSVSAATPSGAILAATAAAVPPLLPPAMRAVSYGLRTGPNAWLSLVQPKDSSCRLVFPSTIAPAPSRARTTAASCFGLKPRNAFVPTVVGYCRVLTLSLIGTGSPCRGPKRQPRPASRGRARASAGG